MILKLILDKHLRSLNSFLSNKLKRRGLLLFFSSLFVRCLFGNVFFSDIRGVLLEEFLVDVWGHHFDGIHTSIFLGLSLVVTLALTNEDALEAYLAKMLEAALVNLLEEEFWGQLELLSANAH